MLALTAAMFTNLFRVLILLPVFGFIFQPHLAGGENSIQQPASGEVVRGVVQVTGTAAGTGFASYNLAYSFENSDSTNWFPIAAGSQPVNSAILGTWDTTTITDGNYSLKLTVNDQKGNPQEIITQNVLVRNYLSSNTTGTSASLSAGSPEAQGQGMPVSTNTGQTPENPASLQQSELRQAVISGGWVGVGLITLIGVYTLVRRASRR